VPGPVRRLSFSLATTAFGSVAVAIVVVLDAKGFAVTTAGRVNCVDSGVIGIDVDKVPEVGSAVRRILELDVACTVADVDVLLEKKLEKFWLSVENIKNAKIIVNNATRVNLTIKWRLIPFLHPDFC